MVIRESIPFGICDNIAPARPARMSGPVSYALSLILFRSSFYYRIWSRSGDMRFDLNGATGMIPVFILTQPCVECVNAMNASPTNPRASNSSKKPVGLRNRLQKCLSGPYFIAFLANRPAMDRRNRHNPVSLIRFFVFDSLSLTDSCHVVDSCPT